jgi:hypothetical protein
MPLPHAAKLGGHGGGIRAGERQVQVRLDPADAPA